ncbi:MAG: pteridine reductase [Candidatus Thiodiazotropha sp.]
MTQKRSTLSGQTALITGAAHRIGAAIATELHNQGMNILLHYRNSKTEADKLKQQLEQQRPDSVRLARADLNDTSGLSELVDQARQINNRLDLLVNNASSFYPTPLDEATETDWDDLIGSNLKAPFFLSQAAAPLLREQQGSIVNLVDIHALRPLKSHPIYSVAKAGNAMLIKSLARELGPDVRVNGIAPGAILWPEQGLSEATRQAILERTALKRPGSETDIVNTLLFLHRDAPYITGQIIPVDGGRTLQQ